LRLLPLVAATVVLAGCGNDVDDAGSNWPRRDLKIMAPADPGGGWDTTAREMARVMERQNVIDKSVEVYNVSGAGGTIGLAQLASKRSGESNQMMVMGLVMLGAAGLDRAAARAPPDAHANGLRRGGLAARLLEAVRHRGQARGRGLAWGGALVGREVRWPHALRDELSVLERRSA
jgi:hypothetical protein